ncbi:MAG TPA: anti-sigma factor [Aquabacterium sp.]|uniref:anti-sigma factor n=1 Tax=Aquabacterium sp. TaxID=1872578 RepID=UPI002E2F6896|nr:anti-sigma factor [Aquabacterium sp.]HEX5371325.1 anti-sigma factor [Aquabacterium sp.]
MNLQDTQERSANAGEYVLGTLSEQERDTFEAQLKRDRALQAEVYAWQDHLLGFHARAVPADVRPELWRRIVERLGPWTGARHDGARAPAANESLWQGVAVWRLISGVALAASLVLATVLLTSRLQSPATPEARYLAVLQAPDRSTAWIVEAQASGDVRLVPVGVMPPVPAGKAMEFWTKPEGAKGPTSLGLVQRGQTYVVPASKLPALGARQLFELTMEPATGSPIGRPTGPILAVGQTVRL